MKPATLPLLGALQLRSTARGTPTPLRETVAVALVEELLATTSFPLAVPATVGLNCTLRVADCPGVNVSGKVAPDTVKPVPDAVTLLTITFAVPVDVNVTD